MTPYNIYRAFRDGKKLFFVRKGWDLRIVFGSSLSQCHSKFNKDWSVLQLTY